MKLSFLILLTAAAVLTGCNQGKEHSVKMINDTYHTIPSGYTASKAPAQKTREEREDQFKKEMELAKLKSEESLEIAKIEAEAKAKVKRIETEAEKAKVLAAKEVHLSAQKTEKEIAVTRAEKLSQNKEKDLRFYMLLAAVFAALVLIALLIWYLVHRKNKAAEIKMHEEKLRHEAMMEASRQHHEKIGRVLEIIADEHTDVQVRHKLITVLGEQVSAQHLIAYETEDDEKVDDSQEGEIEEESKSDESSRKD